MKRKRRNTYWEREREREQDEAVAPNSPFHLTKKSQSLKFDNLNFRP